VLLRFLLVEAAQVTVRSDPQWRNQFFHLAMRHGLTLRPEMWHNLCLSHLTVPRLLPIT
jgi:hypothetical protein